MDIEEDSLNKTDLLVVDDPASMLGVLAAKIAYYNFEWRFITLVMFNTIQVIGLQTFLRDYNRTITVKLGRFVPKRRVYVSQFVIFAENTSEITKTIQWLVKANYDSNSKFVIICASDYEECDEQTIFETLLKNYILNVILLKISESSNEPLAYSYRIVLPDKCFNGEPDKVDLTKDCPNDKCFAKLFPEKFTNFYKCRLVMSTVEQPPFMFFHNGTKTLSGVDGDIMNLMADMLNATLVTVTPSDNTGVGHYSNNNWTGSLGDIFNGRADASVCETPLSLNKYGNFQISFTYNSMDMVWAAKLPPEKQPYEKLLYPLKFWVRIILFFTFIGIIFLNTLKDTKVWRKVRRTFQIASSNYNMLFYSWLLFLGMPVLPVPTKESLRIMLFIWIWGCFILRSAYQAALINVLKNPAYLKELETIVQVHKYHYPFGGPLSVRDYYSEDREIYDNWISVDRQNLDETLDEILDGTTDFVIASNKQIIKYHIMKYNGTKQLQIIPEKIVNSPRVIFFKKFSPLTAPLSHTLRIALEAGLIQRCYGRYLKHDRDVLRRVLTQRPEPLSLYHFTGCFVIMFIGWFLSVVYFAVEYICGNLKEQQLEDYDNKNKPMKKLNIKY